MSSENNQNLPPEVQEILSTMKAKGFHVEVVHVPMPGRPTSQPSSGDSEANDEDAAVHVAGGIASMVREIVQSGMAALHAHLCPRVKENERAISTLNTEFTAQQKELEALRARLAAIEARNG